MPQHPLHFPVMLSINPLNCFLAGVIYVLALCNTFLGGALPNIFRAGSGVLILDVLSMSGYLIFGGLSNDEVVAFCPALVNVVWNTGFVSEQLLATRHGFIDVYMNGSVKGLGSISACSGAAAYFLKANVSVSIRVLGLLFSILVELQAIALALVCVPKSSTVTLFIDSQALLDICKFNMGSCDSNFRRKCWIEKKHIHHVISNKNLAVTWRKVKRHSGVIENKCADFFVNVATLSKFVLLLSVPYHFLSIEDRPVSENVRHFVRKLFDVINFFFSVWHPDGGICSGYTSSFSASLWFYLIKSLYYCLPVAIRKRLYDLKYPSVVCIKCEMVEKSNHSFLCKHDDIARLDILSNIGIEWYKIAGNSTLGSGGFVLKSWLSDAVLCLGLTSDSSLIVKLVCNIAESHRSNIWLPVTKLRAFYEKCNLLPWDGSVVPSVDSLSSLWAAGTICEFGFRLGVYLCFGLYSCLASLGFGFLDSIPLTDSLQICNFLAMTITFTWNTHYYDYATAITYYGCMDYFSKKAKGVHNKVLEKGKKKVISFYMYQKYNQQQEETKTT
ncbi:hypothetical protein G9A89_014911 [Geosiphon pyriformis]|nr:hypothetical protein G9A89_014911 [Geosiphon pyriformis]